MKAAAFLAATLFTSAQEAAPELNALEKEFQDTLTGAVLDGHFTRTNSKELSQDKYTIVRATKLKGDMWRFEARIQYGNRDITIPLDIEVKWAGDTPVITVTDREFPMGVYTARVVIYRGQYAGTWSGKTNGGQMFGKIVRAATP